MSSNSMHSKFNQLVANRLENNSAATNLNVFEWQKNIGKTLPTYMARHAVKAGMTGWAQVNGWRGNTSLRKRLQYDLYYIVHWTPWLDLKILWMTVFHGFTHKNAY